MPPRIKPLADLITDLTQKNAVLAVAIQTGATADPTSLHKLTEAETTARTARDGYLSTYTPAKHVHDTVVPNVAAKKAAINNLFRTLKANLDPANPAYAANITSIDRVIAFIDAAATDAEMQQLVDYVTPPAAATTTPPPRSVFHSDHSTILLASFTPAQFDQLETDIKTQAIAIKPDVPIAAQSALNFPAINTRHQANELALTSATRAKADKAAEIARLQKEIAELNHEKAIEEAVAQAATLNTGGTTFKEDSAREMIAAWHDAAAYIRQKPHLPAQPTATTFSYKKDSFEVGLEQTDTTPGATVITPPGAPPAHTYRTKIKIVNSYVKEKSRAHITGDLTDDAIIMSFKALSKELDGQFRVDTKGDLDTKLRMIAIADYLNTSADPNLKSKGAVKKADGVYVMTTFRHRHRKKLKELGDKLRAGESTMPTRGVTITAPSAPSP
mgnify:CR=1 FL=1